MLGEFLRSRFSRITQFAALPEDSEEETLQKSSLIISSVMFIPAGALWGSVYIVYGEVGAGLIPLGYSLFSLISLIYLSLTKQFNVYRVSQLALILLCPFFLMMALGGFFNGSAVILWSVFSPFGAILFARPARAPRWLIAYLGLMLLSGLLQPLIARENNLPTDVVIAFFVLNLGTVSAAAFVLVLHFVRGKNEALHLLALEREKSDRLLLNVLPAKIAARLKEGQGIIADHYDSASVLFADIVGFTRLSMELTPQEMVALLNSIFSHFDGLVEKYGLEKIRTIGDNYMVASGVPASRPDHAQALAAMALEMVAYVEKDPACVERGVQFRLGVNSGPLVAGVLGKHKFHYDIWGDTVNTASRMESNGAPGEIQITRATYELIKDQYHCTPRGSVAVKSKGQMPTWFLEGERPPPVRDNTNPPGVKP